MTDRTIKVRLEAITTGFASALTKAQEQVKGLSGELGKASQSDAWKQTSTSVLAVGGAATAALGLAANASVNFDKQMSSVKATGAEAAANFRTLRQAAIDAGGATAFSAGEAAQGMEALLKAGVSVNDVLSGGLSGSLDLAAAGQLDLATAAETAASAMTQFKLSGDQVPRIADALAAGAGKAQGDVSDLAQALGQSGLVASQFGLSLEETVGGLSAFASAGLMGSDSGTSFKTMLLALAKPSKEAAAEMERLGISAYDAQGQFVGLEGLAGQLKSAMTPLSEETRQAALATIFGTDAIRSASVLYEQGAEGIAKWTGAVSESGYAAEVAATLQDNLAGDLEKLSGAVDTLMISLGDGQNAPLRGLVQTITDLVDAASSNPQAVGILGAQLGVLAAGGIAVGAAMKVTTSVVEFRTALDALATTSPRAAAGIKLLTTSAVPAGVALMALTGLIGTISSDMAGYAADVEAYADALKLPGEEAEKASRKLAAEALAAEGVAEALGRLGEDASIATDAALGSADARDSLIDAYDREISKLRDLADEQAAQGVYGSQAAADAERMIADRDRVVAAIDKELEKRGKSAETLEQETALMGPAAEASGALADAAGLLAEETERAAQAHEDWLTALSDGSSAFVDGMGAWDAVIAKNQEVAQSTADSTESMDDSWEDYYDGHTVKLADYIAELEAQVAAQGAWEQNMLLLTGRASDGLLGYLAELGPEGADLVAQLVNGTDAELQVMEQNFGDQAGASADAWSQEMATRSAVWKELTAKSGAAAVKSAQSELAAGKTTLQSIINSYGLTIKIGVDKTGYWDAMNTLNSIAGKTVSTYVAIKTYGQGALATGGRAGDVVGLADGGTTRRQPAGRVYGPGTPTSDSVVDVALSRDEFVVKAAASQHYGYDAMYALNSMQIPKDYFKPLGLAGGGSPSHAYYSPARLAGGGMAGAATGAPVLSDNDVARIADAVRYGASTGTREGIAERDSMQAHAIGRRR